MHNDPVERLLTYIAGIATGALIIGVCTIASCTPSDTRSTAEYIVLIDETDTTFAVPDTGAIAADLGIDANIWNGVTFSVARITDVSYTPRTTITLPEGGSRILSSEAVRKREVAEFKAQLADLLDSVRHDTSGRPHSSIYLPLVEELNRLAESTADRKVLIVMSDLRENRPALSFYDPRTRSMLASSPEKIEEAFFALAPLPDLAGIEIRLVYEPKNAADDEAYRLASGLFKRMFESRGAVVSISATLNP